MRKTLILIFFLQVLLCNAANTLDSRSVVASFGDNLRMWLVTNNPVYRQNIEAISNSKREKCRISDQVTTNMVKHLNLPIVKETFTLDTYLNSIQNAMRDGVAIKIQMDNYKQVEKSKIQVYGAKRAKDIEEIDYVSCNVYASAPFKCTTKDLFYVRKGKITKIAPYEIDEKTHKVHVDLSDIDFDDETVGLTYNYGQHFNIGASFNYAVPWFLIAVDWGLANKMDATTSTKVELTNIMNYKITTTSLKPKMFFTATPALNLKYVAVGCGAGILYMEGTETTNTRNTNITENDGNSTIQYGGSSTTDTQATRIKFMLRPSIKGFIPMSDEWSLVVGAGYDYVFKYKKCNGFNFSLGLQYSLY